MTITYAQFNLTHNGKQYACQMTIQGTYKNSRQVSATVVDANNKTLLVRSMSGRQIISYDNAREAVYDALESAGLIKKRPKRKEQKQKTNRNPLN